MPEKVRLTHNLPSRPTIVPADHLPALAALGDRAPPLKAVYSRSEKSAADLAQAAATLLHCPPPSVYHDAGDPSANLDALLARPDISAVLVVLPIAVTPGIVERALAAGKHVVSTAPSLLLSSS